MKKTVLIFFLIGLVAAWFVYNKYQDVYGPNVSIEADEIEFFISTGSTYEEVEDKLISTGIVDDEDSFIWVAEKKNYPSLVKPGRYIIRDAMSNNDLVDLLRSGNQTPVRFAFNNVRNLSQLAGRLAQNLEADSIQFLQVLSNDSISAYYGFDRKTFISMFIPNTYEFFWTTTPEAVVLRMAQEFKKFWSDERLSKARSLGLTQSEIVTLASIVQAEQNLRKEEWPTIAGLYLNRVRQGIPLQSDPTVIFAVGDFSMRRVLRTHLKIKSPYNTYVNQGLPPGPIRMPDIGAVDAVLNADDHDYIFMCAKADLSGYHHFTKTNREHNRYAREYRRMMDRNKVYK